MTNPTTFDIIGAVAIIDGDVFEFDAMVDAEDFAAAFGGAAFPIVDTGWVIDPITDADMD